MRKKWNRIGADVIDFSICIAFGKLLVTIIAFTSLSQIFALTAQVDPEHASLGIDLIKIYLFMALYVAIFIAYNTITIHRIGGSFGKLILKVHVLDENISKKKFKKANAKQIFKREYYKWILMYATFGFYALYSFVAIVLFNTEEKKNRLLHDRVAKTITEVWI